MHFPQKSISCQILFEFNSQIEVIIKNMNENATIECMSEHHMCLYFEYCVFNMFSM